MPVKRSLYNKNGHWLWLVSVLFLMYALYIVSDIKNFVFGAVKARVYGLDGFGNGNLLFRRGTYIIGYILSVFLTLFDTFCQKIFNLTIYRAKIVLRPGGNGIV